MIKLHHPESREHLRKHLPEIRVGCEHLKQVLLLELGEDIADAVPLKVADNYFRMKLFGPANQKLDDFLEWLESLQ